MNYLNYLSSTGSENPQGNLVMTIVMIVAMIAFFYFFIIRPQKKQEKEAANMRDGIQVGDEITTIGGIIGKVVSIKDETFVLETTKEKTHIRFLKGAIRSVDVRIADVTAAAEAKDAPAEAAEEAPKKFGFFKKNK